MARYAYVLIATTALLTLNGCSKPAPLSEAAYPDQALSADLAPPPPPVIAPKPSEPASAPQLAYEYEYGFSASAKGVDALVSGD